MRRLIQRHGWGASARQVPRGSTTAKKVAATINALLDGAGHDRIEPLPPHQECLVRHVLGTSLEIWYLAGPDFVTLLALKSRV